MVSSPQSNTPKLPEFPYISLFWWGEGAVELVRTLNMGFTLLTSFEVHDAMSLTIAPCCILDL